MYKADQYKQLNASLTAFFEKSLEYKELSHDDAQHLHP